MYNNTQNSQSRETKNERRKSAWIAIFENNNLEDNKMLEKLIGKRIKVWSAFNSSIGGIRGRISGTIGILNAVDSEFILLDNNVFLSRKFIFRIELV